MQAQPPCGDVGEYLHPLHKYYAQRYRLFSRYDEGILLDDESWYSVTPEKIARHIAERIARSLTSLWPHVDQSLSTRTTTTLDLDMKSHNTLHGENEHRIKGKVATVQPKKVPGIALDPFVGAGGNLIPLLQQFSLVIAIDISPGKIELVRNNVDVYSKSGHDSKIPGAVEYIIGDTMRVTTRRMKADVIVASPPWGGPEYLTVGGGTTTENVTARCEEYAVSTHGSRNDVVKFEESIRLNPMSTGHEAQHMRHFVDRSRPRSAPVLFDLETQMRPCPTSDLLLHFLSICPKLALMVPRNIDLKQLEAILREINVEDSTLKPWASFSDRAVTPICEVEQNALSGKVKMITLYFGSLVAHVAQKPSSRAKRKRKRNKEQI